MERPLPQVGELIIEDYREYKSVTDKKYIKVISYNIELGYRLNQILIDLQQLDPDILFLQEVDIYHLNNQNSVTGIDVFRDLAKHLKMNAMFVGNWRYTSKPNGQGIWGNAILTKFDWKDLMAERLPKVNQVNQHVLCATIQTPIGDIRCFNTHLEVCSGILQRQLQFRHILKLTEQCQLPMLIAGDLNTLGHGILRFSPVHCNDYLRLLSLGKTEAEFWEKTILKKSKKKFVDPFDKRKDVTFVNKVFQGKLDWILLHKLVSKRHSVGTDIYSSDHFPVICEIELE